MFAERYLNSLTSSDLRDDEHHGATLPLHASAVADKGNGALLGSLLSRVKYADGVVHKDFESGSKNLAELVKIWTNLVVEKGIARKWVPTNTAWDAAAAMKLYHFVAEQSLAHWLGGLCSTCNGAGVMETRRTCTACAGTKRAPIKAGPLETEKIKDMLSELEGILLMHNSRAAALLRKVA